jgi:hypothetical protein
MLPSLMRLSLSIVAALVLTGTPNLLAHAGQPNLHAIKEVTLDHQVSQPEIPFIQGASAKSFGAFMIAGGIGAAFDQKSAGKAFLEYMRKNNIDISTIVLNSFTRVIKEDKPFELGVSGDVTLRLVINTYGFGAAGLLGGNDRRPMINITASLLKSDGNVIWKKTDFITNLSKQTDAHTYDQLAQTPQLTSQSFEQASVLVARMILADFKQR